MAQPEDIKTGFSYPDTHELMASTDPTSVLTCSSFDYAPFTEGLYKGISDAAREELATEVTDGHAPPRVARSPRSRH